MPNIGPLELIIVLVIVLLIFGPKRLPSLGKQLGSGMREFKNGITGKDRDDEAAERPAITQATAAESDPVTGERQVEPEERAAPRSGA